jgi:hypothetical protein
VSQDPEAATAFYEGLPDGKAKEQGIYEMARTWGNDDLVGLGEWLNSLPDSRVTDLGVKAYSERLSGESPEAAVASAMAINDDAMRDQTVQRLGQQWFAKDPEAATAWANTNNVPVEALQPQQNHLRIDGLPMAGGVEAMREVSAGLRSGTMSPEQLAALMEAQAKVLEQMNVQREVEFSPDGEQVIIKSVDGAVRIWDAENGTQVVDEVQIAPGN